MSDEPAERPAFTGGALERQLPLIPNQGERMTSKTELVEDGYEEGVRTTLRVPIDTIEVQPEFNARMLDPQDPSLDALAASIAQAGIVIPLIVVPDNDRYLLVAGHRRLAAAQRAGLKEIPVVERTAETAEADAAIENVSRTQLTPLEEGRAVKSMLDSGYTEAGTAELLSVAPQVVLNRQRLMSLPEATRAFFGPGGNLRPGHVDTLAAVATVSPDVCDTLAALWNENPSGEPGWMLQREKVKGLFPAHTRYSVYDTEHEKKDIGVGTKHTNMAKEMADKQSSGYVRQYEPHLGEMEYDAARAAGVLIEFDRYAFLTDKPMLVDLLKRVIEADHAEWKERPKETKSKVAKGADPKAEEKKQARAVLRDLSKQAAGVNLELGAALLDNLSSVDVSMDVARFWVYGLLRSEGHFREDGKIATGYSASYAAQVAQAGLRLVVGDLRSEQATIKKDGSAGVSKVTYATPQECEAWAWKFLDGAKTPEQLFGRGLVMYAAGRYALRHAATKSNQHSDPSPYGYKDRASKALDALSKKHLPASWKQLTKAIDAAHAKGVEVGL